MLSSVEIGALSAIARRLISVYAVIVRGPRPSAPSFVGLEGIAMRLIRILTAIMFCLFVATSFAHAQRRQRHEGFWIGFGIGGGANLSTGLDDERSGGGGGYLRLGGNLSQKLLLGGEIMVWGRRDDTPLGDNTLTTTRSNATITVLFFPSDAGGFFLKAGLGGANIEAEAAGVEVTEQGAGTTFGLGYDVRLGRNIYLTPNVDWMFQTFENNAGDRATNTLLLVTVGLTWH